MIDQSGESPREYELPNAHPWFEQTSFDWLFETAILGCVLVGAFAMLG